MRAGGKKTQSARKNTMLEKCDPDPDQHESAHITLMATALGTPDIPLQWAIP